MTISLPSRESLHVEFKSDLKRLSDTELVEALVCLANAEGGELWLGVEDNGTPTGLHAEHQSLTGLPGLVAARTSPSLAVGVDALDIDGVRVARIAVAKAQTEVSTAGGVYLRRRLKHDGTPECAPMLPHDRVSRATTFGLIDVSAQPVAGARLSDLDPLERERLRQSVQQYGGDRVLLELDDEALDGALGLTARQADGSRVPTLTGLLLVGRETALRERVPTHEFAFQVLAREAVAFNEFRRFPLLKALDWLETNFRPYNPEHEVQIGLFRVPVPKVDLGAFREGVANALVHRDYHRLGAVHVRMDDEGLAWGSVRALVLAPALEWGQGPVPPGLMLARARASARGWAQGASRPRVPSLWQWMHRPCCRPSRPRMPPATGSASRPPCPARGVGADFAARLLFSTSTTLLGSSSVDGLRYAGQHSPTKVGAPVCRRGIPCRLGARQGKGGIGESS
ncbi:AlbA family DNA-binding domain-containing protein [Ralstonia mannitolilytica]|uniref:Schlafen AlbA-2 domain-containing protein n=1 Tax=Ralstonia mannitolilytica TaxID=105219 RepID=A0AAD2ENY0_9RALS|nr:RNA-binding domain-containing protein [Ralstonia mannitolilytica]MBY4717951.1 putative DNA binding domain-containing protein [Ralstonia mannitolilytica]CAJ0691372.1 hypothetical protein R77591_03742 [Ralstonia mannitolilytica]CAJ0880036.1 hypothetical protein R77569_03133 [Ralstonia mannitolilytica]